MRVAYCGDACADAHWAKHSEGCYAEAQALEREVQRANAQGGPQVRSAGEAGLGLFAERDYRRGEHVTRYGGVRTERREGDYVIETKRGNVDAEERWLSGAKGRFVNDAPARRENLVMRLVGDRKHWDLAFVTKRRVREGEEFLWYYGRDYDRPWRRK